ncbi:MAG: alpha/beta fold hydrolase [Spirochaetes bacterium]|nr:alpha/beta fold hydrolase [Spirochaetota bacterium]
MKTEFLHNPHLEGEAFFWEAGPVGVFLSHGYTATTAEVRPLAKKLHEQGYTVAGPLLPGHGTEPGDLNRVRWQDWTAEGEKTYLRLQERCERIFVGGESMGAMVALSLAIEHPDIAGVLCYAPAAKLAMKPVDIIKLYLGSSFIAQVDRSSLDCAETWQGYPGLPLKGAIQLLQMQKSVRSRLRRIHQPIIIFQGRKDTTVDPGAGDIIAKAVASDVKELHWMENSNHAVTLDRELDRVSELSVEFIRKVLAS